jgi:hypothetical protein
MVNMVASPELSRPILSLSWWLLAHGTLLMMPKSMPQLAPEPND